MGHHTQASLLASGTLRHYDRCPACGDTGRRAVEKPSYVDRYIVSFARELQIVSEDVIGLFDVYRCDRCETIYSDPWLTGQGMNVLYGRGQSQHLLGWQQFYEWVQEPAGNYLRRCAPLWNLLAQVSGGIQTYGEMNCPFAGFLMYLKTRELHSESISDHVAHHIHQMQRSYLHPYDRGRMVNRVVGLAQTVGRRLGLINGERMQSNFFNANALSLSMIKRSLEIPGYRPLETSTASVPAAPVPSQRYLVYQPTSCFWTTNCVSLNCTCRSMSTTALGTPVIDFGDVSRDQIHFDVFGFFNCLDHFVEPKAILARALEHSRVVFIDTHRSDEEATFSRQHLYAFGQRFLEAMKEPEWSVVDITALADKTGQRVSTGFENSPDQNWYLVSKEIDLSAVAVP
jgi:hypothetical protein